MQVSSIEYTGTGSSRQQQLVTSNAAKASINGIEGEWSWRLNRATRLTGHVSVLDAKYDDFLTCDSALLDCSVATNVSNLSGQSLPHAPKFSSTLALEHDIALGNGRLTPRAQVHHQSRTKLGPFGDMDSRYSATARATPDARFQGAYTTADLGLRYEEAKGRWYIEAFVVNIGNEKVKTDASWVNSTWTSFYNPPRTYGLRSQYRF